VAKPTRGAIQVASWEIARVLKLNLPHIGLDNYVRALRFGATREQAFEVIQLMSDLTSYGRGLRYGIDHDDLIHAYKAVPDNLGSFVRIVRKTKRTADEVIEVIKVGIPVRNTSCYESLIELNHSHHRIIGATRWAYEMGGLHHTHIEGFVACVFKADATYEEAAEFMKLEDGKLADLYVSSRLKGISHQAIIDARKPYRSSH